MQPPVNIFKNINFELLNDFRLISRTCRISCF